MSQPIISVENLGKRYRIHHEQREGYTTLRDVIARKVKGLFLPKSEGKNPKSSDEDFWALKGVSFEVQPGEVVGIIGGNGAGKSTLLKILSRITESTEGRVTLRGRVASLLEVGTGFHPELTGRENIFLNGAILGMTRCEIRKQFDEIVAFAEIEKFLDTPVKRYSSGMYVRLAFAVAAHLESEILVVDEVLAVGDAPFQAKCLKKMDESSSKTGRTVLFVSHNLTALQRLCRRGIFLERGRVVEDGPITKVLDAYQRSTEIQQGTARDTGALKPGEARWTGWCLADGGADEPHTCPTGSICEFRVDLASRVALDDATIGFVLWNSAGQIVVAGNTLANRMSPLSFGEGHHVLVARVRLPVKAGLYQLDVSLNSQTLGQLDRAFLEPKLHVMPPETTLPEEWHGLLTEPLSFKLNLAS
jgi:ABC-type polysaccharide/polyol phosphate transport system ATPase subunit